MFYGVFMHVISIVHGFIMKSECNIHKSLVHSKLRIYELVNLQSKIMNL
jgi:hypothetical protein